MVNDTVALVGPPIAYVISRVAGVDPRVAFLLLMFSITVGSVMTPIGNPQNIAHRGFIPLIIATAMYIVTSEPRKVLAGVDWGTIIFFITMFVTMDGIWKSGVLQPLLSAIHPYKFGCLLDIASITVLSVIVSQALSNVPFTNIYVEYMKSLGYTGLEVNSWLTLAFVSTIAGNLTLLGAASNIIVVEMMESKYGSTVTFKEFFKVGVVVTSANIAIYLAFLLI
ncbi:MAG: SLC13 family permease [Candidatus Nezhaarchaeales archaeon]